ncbi:S9 family peptidase [Nocardiopsis metallicus]|uniref:Dipeptidyl aminopeptidase/acylaminoacyl peptidase n=1 Tax=Nocardiopsis metallicus TaxID=179819 RepID=A0A840W165_9ACTN|nr:prolyl oligopeptidase family serine peptidase [Nocardiopsis metallicus]MBB5489013.1 dipeptidyl aminopeptidase/acylaminoacyl peptidase [Nocardiopsis metallicus]
MSELSSPHGSWPSPISAGDVARGVRQMAYPSVLGGEVWWEEYRPSEEGRTTLVRRDADGTVHDLLPVPWSVGTRVHEYGGRSYLPVPRRDDKAIARVGVVFANSADQRLYLLERGAREPVPLTPEPVVPGALRYADPALSSDGKQLLCVREQHAEGTARRSIVSVPLSGRGAQDPAAIRELVSGSHFYASPTPSPDGTRLAYVRWNHPRMPWDGTELRVGELTESGLVGEYTVKGGVDESVLSPVWADDSTLYLASDWPGFWNLYQAGLKGQAIALYPAEEEFHSPPWRLGDRCFRVLDSGKIVALHGDTAMRPSVYDPDTLDLEPVSTELTSWSQLDSDGTSVVAIAASAGTAGCLVRLDPVQRTVEVLQRSMAEPVDPAYLPQPHMETLPGRYGATVHANVYPPTNPEVSSDGPAPYVVWAHGGPIGHADRSLDLVKAYFTSRGIGVVDVDYGGSTGYGRSYRKRLHKEWGAVDVEDCTAAARALVERGLADPERLAIRGPSAGGLTALLALTGDTFACGVSYFGVADLLGLVETTHDFESHFLDTLIGTLPGFVETYRERSPINRTGEIDVPVLLFQGLDDKVVTPDQSFRMAAALGERQVPHALLEFEGEAHGFRTETARVRTLETELAFYAKVFGFEPDVAPMELTTEPPEPRTADPEDDLPVAEPLPEVTPVSGVTAGTGEPVLREPVQQAPVERAAERE